MTKAESTPVRTDNTDTFKNALKKIVELTEENEQLKAQIEKMKKCTNCKHYAKTYELCCYSLGDEDYDCRLRKWKLKE